jgi:hypothetical protein
MLPMLNVKKTCFTKQLRLNGKIKLRGGTLKIYHQNKTLTLFHKMIVISIFYLFNRKKLNQCNL